MKIYGEPNLNVFNVNSIVNGIWDSMPFSFVVSWRVCVNLNRHGDYSKWLIVCSFGIKWSIEYKQVVMYGLFCIFIELTNVAFALIWTTYIIIDTSFFFL